MHFHFGYSWLCIILCIINTYTCVKASSNITKIVHRKMLLFDTHTHTHIYIYIYTHTHKYTYRHIYKYIYIIYIHIYIYTLVVVEERPPPTHTHMIVKGFGCTAIHNKALYICIIHIYIHIHIYMNKMGGNPIFQNFCICLQNICSLYKLLHSGVS